MKTVNKYIFTIIASLILGLAIGFFINRKTIDVKETIRYEKGETIVDTITILEPYKVEIPAKPIYIYRTDTINSIFVEVVDTSKIIEDWILSRNYNVTLFDNDNGKLNIDANVQYNKLNDLKYTFTPIQKVITNYKEPVYIPFVGISYNSLGNVSAGAGLFYHDIGFELRYITDFNKKGIDIGLKYKF